MQVKLQTGGFACPGDVPIQEGSGRQISHEGKVGMPPRTSNSFSNMTSPLHLGFLECKKGGTHQPDSSL